MVWIEKHRPQNLSAIVGQDQVIARFSSWAAERNLPHLIIAGPHGTGKSAAVECLARALYGDTWLENTTILPAGDLFGLGKSFLESDDRFSHIFKKDESLIANFKYVVKWYASMRPLNAPFKLIVFEEAHALTRDAQQALRRIMEKFSQTCRFIFCTTNPSAILPAISSRCYPISFSPIPEKLIQRELGRVLAIENVTVDGDDLDLVVRSARGDLRRALMLLQVLADAPKRTDLSELARSESDTMTASVLRFLREKDLFSAQKTIESLMIDDGLTGPEVLQELARTVEREYNDPRLALLIAATDQALVENGNEFIQMNALLARMLHEVIDEEGAAALR
ncbi:MAG: AAA family ATPase [Methanomicrobiales archaeon]|nr:AAA family ATPase [Methanomicrobiales archaeon]